MDHKINENDRCPWCLSSDIYIKYHDEEWGVPNFDEHRLFEKLVLEGAQAGLSWITILKKRENYRKAFDSFDPEKMARYTEEDVQRLLQNPGIIRNKAKIRSAISNAKALLDFREKNGSLVDLCWSFVDHTPILNHFERVDELPATTPISDELSKALRSIGFRFIGSTTTYAFMQSVGMVNDHLVSCFRHQEVQIAD